MKDQHIELQCPVQVFLALAYTFAPKSIMILSMPAVNKKSDQHTKSTGYMCAFSSYHNNNFTPLFLHHRLYNCSLRLVACALPLDVYFLKITLFFLAAAMTSLLSFFETLDCQRHLLALVVPFCSYLARWKRCQLQRYAFFFCAGDAVFLPPSCNSAVLETHHAILTPNHNLLPDFCPRSRSCAAAFYISMHNVFLHNIVFSPIVVYTYGFPLSTCWTIIPIAECQYIHAGQKVERD